MFLLSRSRLCPSTSLIRARSAIACKLERCAGCGAPPPPWSRFPDRGRLLHAPGTPTGSGLTARSGAFFAKCERLATADNAVHLTTARRTKSGGPATRRFASRLRCPALPGCARRSGAHRLMPAAGRRGRPPIGGGNRHPAGHGNARQASSRAAAPAALPSAGRRPYPRLELLPLPSRTNGHLAAMSWRRRARTTRSSIGLDDSGCRGAESTLTSSVST
jgi:hypothetical protein